MKRNLHLAPGSRLPWVPFRLSMLDLPETRSRGQGGCPQVGGWADCASQRPGEGPPPTHTRPHCLESLNQDYSDISRSERPCSGRPGSLDVGISSHYKCHEQEVSSQVMPWCVPFRRLSAFPKLLHYSDPLLQRAPPCVWSQQPIFNVAVWILGRIYSSVTDT